MFHISERRHHASSFVLSLETLSSEGWKKKKDKAHILSTFIHFKFPRSQTFNHLVFFFFPCKPSSPFQFFSTSSFSSRERGKEINRYISNTETHSVFIFCLPSLLSRVINCKHHHCTDSFSLFLLPLPLILKLGLMKTHFYYVVAQPTLVQPHRFLFFFFLLSFTQSAKKAATWTGTFLFSLPSFNPCCVEDKHRFHTLSSA